MIAEAGDGPTVVVVGGGGAGATAARTLAAEGFAGQVLLLCAEDAAPYDRTEISKALLTGDRAVPSPLYPDDLGTPGVTVRTGTRVVAIDRASATVTLDDATTVGYDHLVLATGARARRPPLPGIDLGGVHLVRGLDTAPDLRAAVRGGHLVVVGGGLIGLEVAAAAREHATAVTVVEATDRLMGRVLPPSIAGHLADVHTARGVDLRLGTMVAEFVADGHGRVAGVRLASGETLAADAVVVAVGVEPETGLAADAGLAVDDGIVVDRRLRTADPRILAVGDAARIREPDGRLAPRSESWLPALGMGQHAARSILGNGAPYDEVPSMWSDQYDLRIQGAGHFGDDLTLVARGEITDPDGLVAFGLQDDRVRAAVGVSHGKRVGRTVRAAQLLIRAGIAVDADQLRDPGTDLRRLATG